MKTLAKVYVGVDISKAYMDIYIHPCAKTLHVENSEKGIVYLLKFLATFDVQQIVCEASGGYQKLLILMAEKAGYKTWEVDPKRIKAFIESEGVKIKTDKNDAKMIALFSAQKIRSYEAYKPSDAVIKLRALVTRRDQLIKMLSNEKKHLQQAVSEEGKKLIKKHMKYLENMISSIDLSIDKIIKSDTKLSQKAEIMVSVPGIGPVTTSILLAVLPECGTLDNKQIASLAGVAPYTKQSGIYKGHSSIAGGRSLVRRAIYMAALTAAHCKTPFRDFYQRLRNRGKPAKVALVAVMRKIIVILNVLLKKQETWKKNIETC